MGASAPQTFKVTPDQFIALVAKAKAEGLEISGNAGTASRMGVTMSWNYDPAAGNLTLQILRAPLFLASKMSEELAELVTETLSATN